LADEILTSEAGEGSLVFEQEDSPTTVGGLRAFEMFFRGIREIDTGAITFFQSKTRLNTPKLGTIPSESFREVAELSKQCISVFELELAQAVEAIQKFTARDFFFRWLSVYLPPMFLLERMAEQKMMSYIEDAGIDSNRICFELPLKLLTEGNARHAKVIGNLRNRGFHFILTGFGGTNCPLMKLSEFPVDYVMLSKEITSYIGKSDRSNAAVHSIVDFVDGLGADTIADGIVNSSQAEILFQNNCHYVAGPLSGKYTSERYVRKKNDEILEKE